MIRVVVDDLAFVSADAVVRVADETLEPVTSAMARLDRQAGARFAAERQVQSPLDAGAAVVTGGGDLAAPFVLHVVIQDTRGSAGRDVVRRALTSAWQRAAEWGLNRVAAPLVGASAGRLSMEDAAMLMLETFPESSDLSSSGRPPRELSIVVEREDERSLIEAIIRRQPNTR